MEQQSFVQGLIFDNPASFIEPFSRLGDSFFSWARSLPKKEFIVFFLGRYGQAVYPGFGQLRKRYPIWVRRGDITMDVYSEEGFILLSDGYDPVRLLAECCNCDIACFVMESHEPGSLALAETIGRILRECTDPVRVCFAKDAAELGKAIFDLHIEPVSSGKDICTHLLITLYNNYLGERGFQDNILTAKSFYGDVLRGRYPYAQGGMAIHRGGLKDLDVQGLASKANGSIRDLIPETQGHYLTFLEMHPSQEDIIMLIACRIERELHKRTQGLKDSNGNLIVCNCAHPQDEIKLTLFYLYKRQASE